MGIYPETQEALREAGGGSFKNERPIAYRAKKSAYRMWASPLCFAASISWHLIFIPVTSPPRSDYFSFPHLIAASLWNSSHRIPLPVHLASAHLISAHAIHLISCLLESSQVVVHARSPLRSCFQLTHPLAHLLNGTVLIFSYFFLFLIAAHLISRRLVRYFLWTLAQHKN